MSQSRPSPLAPAGTSTPRRRVLRTPAVNPGPGSYRLLAMLGRLGVAGIEPLACALRLSTGATYNHVRRLEKAGLLRRVPIGDGGGGAVAISRSGALHLRDDDLPAVAPKSQVPSSGEHSRAVSLVAANFELRGGYGWLGPAELRRDDAWRLRRDDGAGHLPDLGLVTAAGSRIAIEVELHSKAHARLRAILRGYRGQIDRGTFSKIAYVTTKPTVAKLVRRHADDALLGDRRQLIALDKMIELARRRARADKSGAEK